MTEWYENGKFCYDEFSSAPIEDKPSCPLPKEKKKCVCGAHKTSNPNLHAYWCDLA